MLSKTQLNAFAWLVSLGVALTAIFAWGQQNSWQLSSAWPYQLFPLLGLLAFSLMWSHYVASVARQLSAHEKGALSTYFEITSWIVLLLFVLHPTILVVQLFRDGAGLPPFSYMRYVGASLEWLVLLGTFSFFAFLAYELHHWFKGRSWWRYVEVASDVAMVSIFIHSYFLGSTVQLGWMHYLWQFYGATLAGCLLYIYFKRFKHAFDQVEGK